LAEERKNMKNNTSMKLGWRCLLLAAASVVLLAGCATTHNGQEFDPFARAYGLENRLEGLRTQMEAHGYPTACSLGMCQAFKSMEFAMDALEQVVNHGNAAKAAEYMDNTEACARAAANLLRGNSSTLSP